MIRFPPHFPHEDGGAGENCACTPRTGAAYGAARTPQRKERFRTLTREYLVCGGKPLFGEVTISGAKNAAVAIIPAALMVDGVCRIENVPIISDVTLSLKILEELGASIRVLNSHTVEIDSRHITCTRTS